LVMTGSVAVIPYAHEIAETHSLQDIHTLNLAGVAAFAVCMVSRWSAAMARALSNRESMP